MKKRIIVAVTFIFLALVLAVPAILSVKKYADAKAASQLVSPFEPYDMVHVLLYGYDRDTVSGRIMLYARDGSLIANVERSWNADALMLEYAEVSFDQQNYSFPYRICTNTSGRNRGLRLASYFLDDKECLLCGQRTGQNIKRQYYAIALYASARLLPFFYSQRSIHTVSLSVCTPGTEYEIRFLQDGSASIMPVAR